MTTLATKNAISVTVVEDRIHIRAPFSLKETLKALPGARWNAIARAWTVPATVGGANAVLDALRPCGLDDVPPEIEAMVARAADAAAVKDAAEGELAGFASRTRPWHHQTQATTLIAQQPATLLFHEMGCGKSKCVVDAVCNLDGCRKALIICPKSVVAVWPGEFKKHGREDVKVRVVALDGGTLKFRRDCARQALELAPIRGEKAVIVINYEAAWQEPFRSWALGQAWDLVAADEIHRIKAPGGKWSRFMADLAGRADRRVGLSGTPMAHSPLDVYGEFRFLDPGVFGTSFTRFRARYAVMGGFQQHEVIAYANEEELNRKFYSIAHRVKKADVLDLPKAVHEERRVELGADAARVYRQLEQEMIADVKGGVVTAANALARLLRLQQVTSGFVVAEDEERSQQVEVDRSKRQALLEILDDVAQEEPVVVFCRFRHDLEVVRACAADSARRAMELSGRINELAAWQQDRRGSVLGVQIQAGGVGIDLTRAAYCVYFSLGFSLGDYVQSLARLDRPGQTRSVTYLHLVAAGTVDQKVYAALQKRADVIENVLAELKGE